MLGREDPLKRSLQCWLYLSLLSCLRAHRLQRRNTRQATMWNGFLRLLVAVFVVAFGVAVRSHRCGRCCWRKVYARRNRGFVHVVNTFLVPLGTFLLLRRHCFVHYRRWLSHRRCCWLADYGLKQVTERGMVKDVKLLRLLPFLLSYDVFLSFVQTNGYEGVGDAIDDHRDDVSFPLLPRVVDVKRTAQGWVPRPGRQRLDLL